MIRMAALGHVERPVTRVAGVSAEPAPMAGSVMPFGQPWLAGPGSCFGSLAAALSGA